MLHLYSRYYSSCWTEFFHQKILSDAVIIMILIVAESFSFWRIYTFPFLVVHFILVYSFLENDFIFHKYNNSVQKQVTVLVCICFHTMCMLQFSLCMLKHVIILCCGFTQLHKDTKFLFGPFPIYFCSCRYSKYTGFLSCSNYSCITFSAGFLFPGTKCSSPVVDNEYFLLKPPP